MMGIGGGAPGGFGNFLDLIELLEDKTRYAGKLKELDAKVKEANDVMAGAVENNRKADAQKQMAEEMVKQADQKVAIVNASREEQSRKEQDLIAREQSLTSGWAELKTAQEDFTARKLQGESDLVVRDQKATKREADVQEATDALIKRRQEADVEIAKLRADAAAERDAIIAKAQDNHATSAQLRKEADAIKASIEQRKRDFEAFFKKS